MKKTYIFLLACILIAASNVTADEGDIQSSASNNNSSIGTGSISSSSLEEIVVTARKREESLLDIPESVVAISGLSIDRRNIKGLDKIGLSVPNLNLAMRTDGYPNVSIRGIGAFGLTQGVGFYIDDVQLFSDASSRFGDLERIEVLKGPQGTLYGGSNIGGAVKYVSKRPNADETSGRLKLLGGEQGVIDIEASVNMPIGDNGWAIRAFGFTREDDGFMYNPNSDNIDNQPTDVGAYEESGGRLSISGDLSDNLSLYATVRYNEYDGPVNNWARELGRAPNFTYPTALDAGLNPSHKRETFGAHLELVLERDGYDVTSVTSYTDAESTRITDVDLTQFWFMNTYRPEEFEVITQEIRFTSTTDSNFQWIAGVYASKYTNNMNSYLHFGPGIILPDTDFILPFELRDEENTHMAAFANVSYEEGDWKLDLGVRIDSWEEDEKNLDVETNGAIHSGVINNTEVLPRISVTRNLNNDSIAYLTISKGFEPGGLNGSTPIFSNSGQPTLLEFEPEEAVQFELGWKGSFNDGRGTASVAAFFIDYKNRAYQVLTPNPNGPGLIEGITNVGNTEQNGIEFELAYQLNDNHSISLSGGMIDAEWDNGTIANDVDLGGLTPANVIKNSFSFNYSYDKLLANDMNLVADMQLSYQGEGKSMPPWDSINNPDYTVINLQAGIIRGPWEFMLNLDNATDENYYTDLENFPNFGFGSPDIETHPTIVIGTHGHPRIFSASLTYNF